MDVYQRNGILRALHKIWGLPSRNHGIDRIDDIIRVDIC